MRLRLMLLAGAITVASSSQVSSKELMVGQRVYVKSDARAMVDDRSIDAEMIPFSGRIAEVDGDWLWLGNVRIHKTDALDAKEAIAYFTKAIEASSTDVYPYLCRANIHCDEGSTENALADYSAVLKLDPANVNALYNRGTINGQIEQWESAIKDFSEAITLNPTDATMLNNRGLSWMGLKDYDNALKDFDESISLDPANARAFCNRGLCWIAKKDYLKAIQDCSVAVKLAPRRIEPLCARADAFADNGEYDKAIDDYFEALRLKPKSPVVLNSFAWLLATCPDERYRDGAEAVRMATLSCELSKWKSDAKVDTLAAAYAERGDFPTAIEWQQKAIDLTDSDAKKARYRIRLEQYRAGKAFHVERSAE